MTKRPSTKTTDDRALASQSGGHLLKGSPLLAGMTLLASVFLTSVANGAEAPYVLGPQDEIRIAVLEWIASRGEYKQWEALGGEYRIGSAGTVTIPLIGEQHAEGLNVSTLATALSEAFQARTGLTSRPDVSVEVVKYRPVYVVGSVEHPGEFPFRPRMTVLQAVSLAGGQMRGRDIQPDAKREIIRQLGALEKLGLDAYRGEARLARLSAEAKGEKAINFPDALRASAEGRRMITEEEAIFTARAEEQAQQLETLASLQALFSGEVTALEGKMKQIDRQIALVRGEFKNISSLVERGLSPAPRAHQLERTIADLEAERLDITTAIMRARQNESEARRDGIALRTKRRIDITLEFQAAQAELEQIEIGKRTSRRLVLEADTSEALALRTRENYLTASLVYQIVRQTETGAQRIKAEEHSPLLPGDVLKVDLRLMGDSEPAQTSSAAPTGRMPVNETAEALPVASAMRDRGRSEDPLAPR